MNEEPLGLNECSACRRLIRWALTAKNRKAIPLDAVPVEGGTFRLEPNPDPGDTRKLAAFVRPSERVGKLWMPHHGTCPQVAKFRKPPVGGHTPAEQALARIQLQAAEIEADRLADELIDLTRKNLGGRFPRYLECRLEWPAFCAARKGKVDRRVLKLVSAAALRKLHPKEAEMGNQAATTRHEAHGSPQ
jgi:hypothetical protein